MIASHCKRKWRDAKILNRRHESFANLSLSSDIIISCSYAFIFTIPPRRPPFPLPKKSPKCAEASFFTLPKRLCCQRGTLRKSLFLPGRASRVPPASPAVLMAVPPPAETLIPGRAALQRGTITIPLFL